MDRVFYFSHAVYTKDVRFLLDVLTLLNLFPREFKRFNSRY